MVIVLFGIIMLYIGYKIGAVKHKIIIEEWGICDGPSLSQMNEEEFFDLISDKICYIREKSCNEQKEKRFKEKPND